MNQHVRIRKQRQVRPKVTKADLDRIADFLRGMGASVAAVEVEPEKVRVITTAGKSLTLPADEGTLDQEMAEHMKKHGYG